MKSRSKRSVNIASKETHLRIKNLNYDKCMYIYVLYISL